MGHEPKEEYASSTADLVYGVNAAGKIVHVSEVSSGLASNCQCPECGKSLIAKKGKRLAHHFAHDALASCNSAPETALHRLAKQIIEERLSIQLPEVKASFGGQSRLLHKAAEVKFDRAIPEARHLNEVVPDLFVERNGRMLLIEMFVTHSCDDVKIAELRNKGIATLEIDLSKTARDSSRDQVERAVLSEAHRYWVYHPQIDAEVAAIKSATEKKQKLAKLHFEKNVTELAAEYLAGVKELAAHAPPKFNQNDEMFRAGLGDCISIEVGGAGCFTVTAREWQSSIIRHAFIPKDDHARSYTPKTLFDWFKKRKMIRQKFRYVAPDLEEALESKGIGFLSPYHAIETYLDALVDRGVLRKTQSYALASDIMSEVSAFRAADAMRLSRTQDLIGRADKILTALPEAERGKMTTSEWLRLPQQCDISFQEAIENDDERFEHMLASLRTIEAMLFRKGAIVEVTLGLPLEHARERERLARKAEADAREAARLDAMRNAREDRSGRLILAAAALGAEGEAWVEAGHPKLGGKRPIDMALSGEAELSEAMHELNSEMRRRNAQEQRDQAIRGWRAELERETSGILGDAAKPFLSSPYPQLGGKKPLDYCVCKVTLQECLDLAKKVKQQRRR